MEKVNKQCLLDTPPHSKGQWKNLVLASDSSNQQTLVLKKNQLNLWKQDFSRICEISNICLDQIHKIIHTWKLYISKLISEK